MKTSLQSKENKEEDEVAEEEPASKKDQKNL